MKDVILEAKDLFFSYEGAAKHCLEGVNVTIKRGQKVAFMGPNGSGKSTFFLCCNGIHKPCKGALFLDGQPLDYSRKGLLSLRGKVGIVFQDPDNQLVLASVYQEISFGILNQGVPPLEAKKEVEQVMEKLDITPFQNQPTHALSQGQKKQVSIADILVMHPEIIILDEPAAALDLKHGTLVQQMVEQFTSEGITVLLSTHDIDYALDWADEIVLMKDGRVLMQEEAVKVCTNKEALARANLQEPVVLRMFETLCETGVLSRGLELPRNINTLESYIRCTKKEKGEKDGDKKRDFGCEFRHKPYGYNG